MKLREALIVHSPSLALQRAAADEIARLDAELVALRARYRHLSSLAAPDPDGVAHHREKAKSMHYAPRRKAVFLQLLDDSDHPAFEFLTFGSEHLNCLDAITP